jgi:hypothetical protein
VKTLNSGPETNAGGAFPGDGPAVSGRLLRRALLAPGLALLGVLLSVPGEGGKAECAVSAAPKMSLTPLRYLKVRVTSEVDSRNRGGNLELGGPGGPVTSSWVNVAGEDGPRTAWVEWRNLREAEPGDYVVRFELRRQGGPACVATDRVHVGGPDDGQ